MKIAISAQGKGPEGSLDLRFGRASGFVIYDTDSDTYDYLDNAIQGDLPQGSGIQTAQMVVDAGAKAIITGRVGPKAEAALKKAGVLVFFSEQDTVQHALEEYKSINVGDPRPTDGGRGVGGGRGIGGGGRGKGGGGGRGMGGGRS
ncbi:NifB/NifX family molybdenum-iron cluster-binding protein [Maridesulfovibrio zosterae]|uniref:NifB/NifX family molybdenum-iron cluster-binding protein n=1 Tax=Maridesulfovibrio zosterae TaxID=82171 RepID=UPI00040C9F17|nr:NifB/NifX family molybdenum-iron cluster-binding protein [Maridesulfovibrio zosterae]